jgi:hypothetical protein
MNQTFGQGGRIAALPPRGIATTVTLPFGALVGVLLKGA